MDIMILTEEIQMHWFLVALVLEEAELRDEWSEEITVPIPVETMAEVIRNSHSARRF